MPIAYTPMDVFDSAFQMGWQIHVHIVQAYRTPAGIYVAALTSFMWRTPLTTVARSHSLPLPSGYYYAAFIAPCVGHKDDESQAQMVIPIPTPDHFKFHSHFRPVLKPHSHPRKHSLPSQFGVESTNTIQTSYRPGGGETICPPPMTVRLAADLRPSADESAPRASLVAVVWIGPDFAHKIGCHGNVLWGVEQLPLELDCSSTVIGAYSCSNAADLANNGLADVDISHIEYSSLCVNAVTPAP